MKVVDFRAEQGFAGSVFSLHDNNFEMELEENEARNEKYIFEDEGETFWN